MEESRIERDDQAAQAEARQTVKEPVENWGAWREGQDWGCAM